MSWVGWVVVVVSGPRRGGSGKTDKASELTPDPTHAGLSEPVKGVPVRQTHAARMHQDRSFILQSRKQTHPTWSCGQELNESSPPAADDGRSDRLSTPP